MYQVKCCGVGSAVYGCMGLVWGVMMRRCAAKWNGRRFLAGNSRVYQII